MNAYEQVFPGITEIARTFDARMIEDEVNPLSFGNAYVVLRAGDMKIRFVRDRGQKFIEIGEEGSDWYDLAWVYEYIFGPEQTSTDYPGLVGVLKEKSEQLKSFVLSSEHNSEGFQSFLRAKRNRFQ